MKSRDDFGNGYETYDGISIETSGGSSEWLSNKISLETPIIEGDNVIGHRKGLEIESFDGATTSISISNTERYPRYVRITSDGIYAAAAEYTGKSLGDDQSPSSIIPDLDIRAAICVDGQGKDHSGDSSNTRIAGIFAKSAMLPGHNQKTEHYGAFIEKLYAKGFYGQVRQARNNVTLDEKDFMVKVYTTASARITLPYSSSKGIPYEGQMIIVWHDSGDRYVVVYGNGKPIQNPWGVQSGDVNISGGNPNMDIRLHIFIYMAGAWRHGFTAKG